MRKKTAGLAEMFRLYLFTRSLPTIITILEEFLQEQNTLEQTTNNHETTPIIHDLQQKFLQPLNLIRNKFALYEQLIEHVLDFNALPDYKVNPKHDPDLQELYQEQKGLEQRAEKVLQDAKNSWASFAEVKLEKSSQYGYILRTTRGEDERLLREKNSSVKILSILKNGTHFTTPILERIAERTQAIDQEYHERQQEIVFKAMETSMTYLPLIESVAVILGELDVLQAFATAASLSPGQYTRPKLHPLGAGILSLKVECLFIISLFLSLIVIYIFFVLHA